MDTGSKSLAQLSEEGKEKKFISIEVGSKVSGYTKDYLERLCRLNKVEYRLRDNGAFAIELESLLNETHTILLSYEGVTFIEKSELTIPKKEEEGRIRSSVLQDVHTVAVAGISDVESFDAEVAPDHFAQPVPRFGDMNKLSQQVFGGNPFSFVGRSVVSDGKTSEVSTEKETHIPIGAGAGTQSPQVIPVAQTTPDTNITFHAQVASVSSTPIPPVAPVLELKEESIPKVASVHTPLHIPISVSHEDEKVESESSQEISHIPISVPHKPAPSVKLAVTRDTTPEKSIDDWDNLLFSDGHISSAPSSPTVVPETKVATPSAEKASGVTSTALPATAPSGFDIASPYRPIKTSVDGTLHHEGGDLFPEISKVPLEAPKIVVQKSEAPSSFVPTGGQKVIVFDPQSLMHADATSAKEIPEAPKLIIPRALPIGQVAQHVTPSSAPDTSVKEQSPVTSPPSIIGDTQIIPKVPLATMRVMPQIPAISPSLLPEIEPEHRVLIREDHPILASRGLNVAFALFIGAASLVLVGGMTAGKLGIDLNSASYVAGVGNVNQSARPSVVPVQYTPTSEVLPFSNDVIVSTSTSSSSVRVTPVFSDGEGTTYQYEMVEQSAVSADSEANPAR